MFHIALTPRTNPANALSARRETLMGAIAQLFVDLDSAYGPEEWFVSNVLEAMKEAVDNLEDGSKPACGSWSDMGMEDDAFSIDIFLHEDARYVKFGDDRLLAPHGAIGLAIGKHNHQEWIYNQSEISDWDEVLLPHVIYCVCKHCKDLDAASGSDAERCEHTGMTRDELESICGTVAVKEIVCKRYHLVDSDSNDMERYADVGDKGKATWNASTEQWSVVWERNEAWGFYTQEELDADSLVPDTTTAESTIVAIVRDIKHGDCTLSALRSDGSLIKLFCFYIDELTFDDSELIGKTEVEAHHLFQQKTVAYLQA